MRRADRAFTWLGSSRYGGASQPHTSLRALSNKLVMPWTISCSPCSTSIRTAPRGAPYCRGTTRQLHHLPAGTRQLPLASTCQHVECSVRRQYDVLRRLGVDRSHQAELDEPAERRAVRCIGRRTGHDRLVRVPYVYSLSYPVEGRIPAQLQKSVSSRDLYQFDSRHHADAPGELSLSWGAAMKPARSLGSVKLTMRAPGTLTEYVGPMQDGVLRTRGVSIMYDAPADMNAFHRNGWLQSREDVLTRPGRRTDIFGAQPLVHAATRSITPERRATRRRSSRSAGHALWSRVDVHDGQAHQRVHLSPR
ncbi:hypothetical protein [Kribbella sp. NPDC050470]|uniref:hypothetical protein n=1 Tax=unclassified Kribbella TaxID=2644121 RepID=UPI0037A9AB52